MTSPLILLSLGLLLCACTTSPGEQAGHPGPALGALALSATVTSTSVVRTFVAPGRFFGVNLDYLTDDDTGKTRATSLSTSLNTLGSGMLRYPGGEKSDNYLWNGTTPTASVLSPKFARTGVCEWPSSDLKYAQADLATPKADTMDFGEFMTVVGTTGADPMIVVAMDSAYLPARCGGTAPSTAQLIESAAAWVENARNNNHQIRYWMIGNESYNQDACKYNGCATASTYANDLIRFATAMKAKDPSIRIVANGDSSAWWKTVFDIAGDKIDYAGVSNYPSWKFDGYTTGTTPYATDSGTLIQPAQDVLGGLAASTTSATNKARIQVILTEFSSLYTADPWLDVNDLGHALVNADILLQAKNTPKIERALSWNTRWAAAPIARSEYVSVKDTANIEKVTNWKFTSSPTGNEAQATGWTLTGDMVRVANRRAFAGYALSGSTGTAYQTLPALTPGGAYYLSGSSTLDAASVNGAGYGVSFYTAAGSKIGTVDLAVTQRGFTFNPQSTSFTVPAGTARTDVYFYKTADTTADNFTNNDLIRASGATYASGTLFSGLSDATTAERNMVTITGSSPSVRLFASRDKVTGKTWVYAINKSAAAATLNLTVAGTQNITAARVKSFKSATSGPTDRAPFWTAYSGVGFNNASRAIAVTLPPVSVSLLEITAPVN